MARTAARAVARSVLRDRHVVRTALPGLAETRQVIAFDLQGHGRTADIDRPLSLEGMADDVAAAVGQLGVEPADIFGYSTGAAVSLQLVLDIRMLCASSCSPQLRTPWRASIPA